MNVFKVHVSFEKIYYVKAGSLAEARELLKEEKLGDSVQQRNVSLLHICTDDELEKLQKEGIRVIGSSDN